MLCACAVAMTLTTSASFAFVLVPMCGAHAETIAAPPISRAAKEVPLEAPCKDKRAARFESRNDAPVPPEAPGVELVPRLPPLRYRLPPAPLTRSPRDVFTSGERPGHQRAIERPPR